MAMSSTIHDPSAIRYGLTTKWDMVMSHPSAKRPGPIKIANVATAPVLPRAVRRLRVRING